jgi:hypothetical protein
VLTRLSGRLLFSNGCRKISLSRRPIGNRSLIAASSSNPMGPPPSRGLSQRGCDVAPSLLFGQTGAAGANQPGVGRLEAPERAVVGRQRACENARVFTRPQSKPVRLSLSECSPVGPEKRTSEDAPRPCSRRVPLVVSSPRYRPTRWRRRGAVGGHRSTSAALGSSRPAAMRKNVFALSLSSCRAYIEVPVFSLPLK